MARGIAQCIYGLITVLGIGISGVPLAEVAATGTKPLTLHIDAAYSGANAEAGQAIEYGIRVALDTLDNRLGGCPVKLTISDHKGNSVRSKRNLEKFLDDPRGLAVFGGLHSSALLANLDFINSTGILLLDPWAAAGPITRSAARPNWVFRLSVDDYVAGEVFAREAVDKHSHTNIGLLLEETGWGDSNFKTMQQALQSRNLNVTSLQRFHWGIGRADAAEIVANLVIAEVDAIFLVANVEEGVHLVSAMADLPLQKRVPIYSHWGITGGRFVELIGTDTLAKVDLRVLQSRFSFLAADLSNYALLRFEKLQEMVPAIRAIHDLQATSGFAHAHDLTLLLNAAAEGINCSDPAVFLRRHIHSRLEQLDTPVRGLVKTYSAPFSVPKAVGDASHEALDIEDLTFGRFGKSGEIYLDHNTLPFRSELVLP